MREMKTGDFNFELPEHLIAQHPTEHRGQSRLMLLDRQTGQRSHRMIDDLPEILSGPGFRTDAGLPLLVFNNSKVRKARIMGSSTDTGAQVEFLLLERVDPIAGGASKDTLADPNSKTWKALVHRAKRRKPGSVYTFAGPDGAPAASAELSMVPGNESGEGGIRLLTFDRVIDDDWLDLNGHVPLPPYIKREDAPSDADRYQTVYASVTGSAAAPTAGLHFTHELLERIAAAGVDSTFITLHVGLGTFLPVRADEIKDHVMHEETYSVGEESAGKIEEAKAVGRKVVAIGTTSVRTLESAWNAGRLERGEFATSMFIYPGFKFNVVDALFTNFHTPESTLLMLVSAFTGREFALESYAEAVKQEYRFFSYGDAMLAI